MEGGKIMSGALHDDMFTPEVIANPYAYYGRLRDEDPVHWNEKYELWVVTRHDDLVWLSRHHELFSSAVFKNDPRPAYPAIDESELGLYEYVRNYLSDQFIQHDRPHHLEMRKVVHGYFTPQSLEEWRPFVRKAVKHLLDAVEDKGRMDVMRDLATPIPGSGNRRDDGRSRTRSALHPPTRREAALPLPWRIRPDETADRRHEGNDRVRHAPGGRTPCQSRRRLHLGARQRRKAGHLYPASGAC